MEDDIHISKSSCARLLTPEEKKFLYNEGLGLSYPFEEVGVLMQNKYFRTIYGKFAGPFISENKEVGILNVDVYDVLRAFVVTCPARQHAIKKILCAGLRGKATTLQDLEEAKQSIERAIEMAQCEQVK